MQLRCFQEEPWFPVKEGYTLIEKLGNENLVEGPRGAKEKEECEVIVCEVKERKEKKGKEGG